MRTFEYRSTELNKIVKDGYENSHREIDYYKVNLRIWDCNSNSTKTLSITNKEYNKIKKYFWRIKKVKCLFLVLLKKSLQFIL